MLQLAVDRASHSRCSSSANMTCMVHGACNVGVLLIPVPCLAAAAAAAAVSQGLAPSTQPAPWDPNAAVAQQAAAPVQPAAPGQEALKSCPNCHEVRSTSQFRAVAGSPDGLAIMCQQCEQVRCCKQLASSRAVVLQRICKQACHGRRHTSQFDPRLKFQLLKNLVVLHGPSHHLLACQSR